MTDIAKWANARVRADYAETVRKLAFIRDEPIVYITGTILDTPSDAGLLDRMNAGKEYMLLDLKAGKDIAGIGYTTLHIPRDSYERVKLIAKRTRYTAAKFIGCVFAHPIERLEELLEHDELAVFERLGIELDEELHAKGDVL